MLIHESLEFLAIPGVAEIFHEFREFALGGDARFWRSSSNRASSVARQRPARYANGFLGDIGVPPDPAPVDYNAWFEVFLDGWFTFDARHNMPRIGRITVARGRDRYSACDVLWATRLEDVQGLDRRN